MAIRRPKMENVDFSPCWRNVKCVEMKETQKHDQRVEEKQEKIE